MAYGWMNGDRRTNLPVGTYTYLVTAETNGLPLPSGGGGGGSGGGGSAVTFIGIVWVGRRI